MRRVLARGRRPLEYLRRRAHQARRQPHLPAERMHLLEVVAEDQSRLLGYRDLQRARIHARIAVAVAADPAADGQERRQPRHARERETRPQRLLKLAVEPRQLRDERQTKVRERVRDLVRHRELGEPQHGGQPEPQHLGVQRVVALGGRWQRDQTCDLALAVEDALSLHLGGMGGKHRADARTLKPLQKRAVIVQALKSEREASRAPRRARFGVHMAPAVLVRVFSDVQQVREIAKRAHYVQRVLDREGVKSRAQLGLDDGRLGGRHACRLDPPEAHRGLADALDLLARHLADLLADDLAKQASEQPPVLA